MPRKSTGGLKAVKKRYAEKHKDKIAAYQKEYRERNKEKAKEYMKNYSANHKPKPRTDEQKSRIKPYVREYHLLKKYGITEVDYQQMLKKQGGKCAICQTTEPKGRCHNRFHVDHCHETGVVRGLLCSRCNMGIGSFGDSPDLIASALLYLNFKGFS